jgi:hypothetical protein
MNDFDISGWAPHWMSAPNQLNLQRTQLLSLRGRRIVDSWLVWDLEHDKWFADLPVILMLDDGRQLEVSWQKFDDLSITWNTIEVSTTPIAWVTWPLTWRSQCHETLRAVTGNTINAVASTEHRFTTRQVAPTPVPGAETNSAWLVGGIWLGTDGVGLHIFNALDENGLSNDPVETGQDNRVLPL